MIVLLGSYSKVCKNSYIPPCDIFFSFYSCLFLFFSPKHKSTHSSLVSQNKLPIDSICITNWQTLHKPSLSNDGNYFMYTINNLPPGSETLVVESTTGNWEKVYPGQSSASFSGGQPFFDYF